jgi:suppressor for copper-sensitivity B
MTMRLDTSRHPTIALAIAALLAAAALPAGAAIPRPEKAKLAMQADRASYEGGATAMLSALVAIDAGWHVNSHTPTYPYLIPTELEIDPPAGWPAALVDYPAAQTKSFAFADVPLSVYDGDLVIKARLRVPEGSHGAYLLHASLHYQACNDSQCLPPVTTPSDLTLQVAARGSSPAAATPEGPAATPEAPAAPVAHETRIAVPAAAGAAAQPVAGAAAVATPSAAAPASAGTAGAGAPRQAPPTASRQPRPGVGGLAGMLLVAVLGGLILNAMPCVLPILSLKVFGLVRSAGQGRREVVRGALATAAGILVSFWALAAVSVAAAAAGAAVGWGVQFQRPGFVTFLVVVMTLFCLNLWGLFEIHLPLALARVGGGGGREGLAGHFGSGLFATLMATPCSAPFLGTAIGFALAQPAPIIFAIFTAVGVGLALPYLVLAAAPAAARLLPRPGAWMDTLRGTMGFVLAASVVWLLYVLGAQVSPERLSLIEVGLLLMALCVWFRHRNTAGAAIWRGAAALATATAAVALVALAASGGGAAAGARTAAQRPPAGLIGWVAFDRSRAESLSAAGRLVFVDVTADWCFTCKVNERLVLDTPEIAGAFSRHHVLPMRADWTNRSDSIGRFLAEHGRYGIPFYLLYRPGREPYVFSELPTKSAILSAVEEGAAAAPGAQARKL